jgi:hypothetical protein
MYSIFFYVHFCRDSSVTRTGRPRFESGHGQGFSLLHNIQAGFGAHSASYPMGPGAISPGVKGPGREAHTYPSSAEVKNDEALQPLPAMSSWHSA